MLRQHRHFKCCPLTFDYFWPLAPLGVRIESSYYLLQQHKKINELVVNNIHVLPYCLCSRFLGSFWPFWITFSEPRKLFSPKFVKLNCILYRGSGAVESSCCCCCVGTDITMSGRNFASLD